MVYLLAQPNYWMIACTIRRKISQSVRLNAFLEYPYFLPGAIPVTFSFIASPGLSFSCFLKKHTPRTNLHKLIQYYNEHVETSPPKPIGSTDASIAAILRQYEGSLFSNRKTSISSTFATDFASSHHCWKLFLYRSRTFRIEPFSQFF